MNLTDEIEYISSIRIDKLPKKSYGRNPGNLVKNALTLFKAINNESELEQEQLNKLIQIHQDADAIGEGLSGIQKNEINKIYRTTLKILREQKLHHSEEIDEIIEQLEKTFNHDNSSFRITGYEGTEIKGNADGLRDFATQLLKTSIGKPIELDEDWFQCDTDDYPTTITLNYYDKSKNDEESNNNWKDKLLMFGCTITGIFILICTLIGFVWIIKWMMR